MANETPALKHGPDNAHTYRRQTSSGLAPLTPGRTVTSFVSADGDGDEENFSSVAGEHFKARRAMSWGNNTENVLRPPHRRPSRGPSSRTSGLLPHPSVRECLLSHGVKPKSFSSVSVLTDQPDPETFPEEKSHELQNSFFSFNNISFVVGRKEKEKKILNNVSHTISSGHVLALIGPSGAGKTTLIRVLTLDAWFGTPYGTMTLNGIPLSQKIFKNHAFVVQAFDRNWPYLTTRETMMYAAELLRIRKNKSEISKIVDEVIAVMGLENAAETRCARLSGGQQRRLSLSIALLKQPRLLILDEPTSGLDSAAASQICREIRRVAKNEDLIVITSIHQPSSKVYEGFDQVMVLSKGREAFVGDVVDAAPYFDSIGYPLPPATNPAEHFLDLVNADFSSSEEVDNILDIWAQKRKPQESAVTAVQECEAVTQNESTCMLNELRTVFSRHFILIMRDPVLYWGRALIFFAANMFFSFVYWLAREYDQKQAFNKVWIILWYVGVPSNMAVVAVYAINKEFKSIIGEHKNGMVQPLSYALVKTVLTIPIMIVWGIIALGLPGFVVMDFPGQAFGLLVLLWATVMLVVESKAESMAVWFDDPIFGMLMFMCLWFTAFLFAGMFLPLEELFWPFKLFYYVMELQYYGRSSAFIVFRDATFHPCDPLTNYERTAVCVNSTSGLDVLETVGVVYPGIESDDNLASDFGILLLMVIVWKIIYLVGVVYKASRVSLPTTVMN